MTRIINTFVVVLSTALSLTTPGEVSAQAAQDITFQQFLEFRINGSVKLEQLNTMAGDWTALKAAMGDPEEEVCEDVFVGEDCTFTWPGVTVWLTNVPTSEWEVSDVLIENGASLHYGAVTLSPGDSIEKLMSHFPEAYANRGAASANDRWGCTHYAAVRRDIATVRFCYDPANSRIQKIVWWNYL